MPRLAIALIAVVLTAACVKPLPPTMVPTQVVTYESADGWQNTLRRYEPAKPIDPERPPVLLVHGMAANHYNFDYRPEVSFADYLQSHGWDVWVVGLPGGPDTVVPEDAAHDEMDFDHFSTRDLPAALDVIAETTGHEQVMWVGHSLGGILLYAALAQYPERIRAGVVVGSARVFEHPDRMQNLLVRSKWPQRKHGSLGFDRLAHKTSFLRRSNPAFARIAYRKNLDWAVALGMARHVVAPVQMPLVRQALSWLRAGELLDRHGEPWRVDGDPGVPVLAIGAEKDRIVKPQDVKASCEQLPGCHYVELEGYGHVDPFVGKYARRDIYPMMEAWLAEGAFAPEPGSGTER